MIKVNLSNNITRKAVIVDENSTLRSVLEQNDIDYSRGMTALDGCTLSPGEIDKTFADFGITEVTYLSVVVKADNAASIKIAGSACVVESAAKLEDIKLLEKFRPNALKLFEGEGSNKEVVFAVGSVKAGSGSINAYGASFGTATTANGKATITMMVPEGTEDPKAWAADKIGVAILQLGKVEQQFAAAIEDTKKEQAAVNECITVS